MATQLRSEAAPANPSGVIPIDLRVLVRPDKAEEKIGGIILPDSIRDQDKHAQTKGTLIAIGENAWQEAAARSPAFRMPVPGDRVLIGKYSGASVKGMDGADYKIMNDEDVIARLEE